MQLFELAFQFRAESENSAGASSVIRTVTAARAVDPKVQSLAVQRSQKLQNRNLFVSKQCRRDNEIVDVEVNDTVMALQ